MSPLAHTSVMYMTTRIVANFAHKPDEIGTAFFFIFDRAPGGDAEVSNHFLITNRHVLEGATTLHFQMHQATRGPDGMRYPTGQFWNLSVPFSELSPSFHPQSDLAAVCLKPAYYAAARTDREIYYVPMWESELVSEELFRKLPDCTPVTMVGYPNGMWDEIHNLPLIRAGHTAFCPRVDYRGQPEGIVDIATFPGSSGSPVLIKHHNLGDRHALLGVMRGVFRFAVDGDVVQIEGTEKRKLSYLGASAFIPMHFGHYVKAGQLLYFKPRD
jgi:hypothetical protein